MNILPFVLAALVWLGQRPAPEDQVILLPQADGRPSAVVVEFEGQQLVLDKPYAAAAATAGRPLQESRLDPAQLQARYGRLLQAQPPRPQLWRLYFEPGQNTLTADSFQVLQDMRQALSQRPDADIDVIGHTDSTGQADTNDALSRQRAHMVRELLIGQGLSAERIESVGRGSRDPLVPVRPQQAQPENRRVDILVR